MEDTTASSVVKFFKNDNGKTNKTLGLVVSIHAISSGRPKINNSKVVLKQNIILLMGSQQPILNSETAIFFPTTFVVLFQKRKPVDYLFW